MGAARGPPKKADTMTLLGRIGLDTAFGGKTGSMGMGKEELVVEISTNGIVEDEEVDFMVQPGTLGLKLARANGLVLEVDPEGEAYRLGVRVGWQMRKLNELSYNDQTYFTLHEGTAPYKTT